MSNKTNNQAGKGDSPRPVTLSIYHKNYDLIFRRYEKEKQSKWPKDQEPFESDDHDNDIKQYP